MAWVGMGREKRVGSRERARVLDRRELALLPGEGRRGDPMPPPSPRESGMGSPSVMATESDREDETVAEPVAEPRLEKTKGKVR